MSLKFKAQRWCAYGLFFIRLVLVQILKKPPVDISFVYAVKWFFLGVITLSLRHHQQVMDHLPE